jgi:hypothetical protein
MHENTTIPEYAASRGARLERVLARASDAPLRQGNRLELLKNGPNTYDDWLQAISRAERWVHLDNYIFENDTTGQRFAEALTAKAAEGVRVRVLHDWFGSMDVPQAFWRELRDAGVEVRAVNPPTLGAPLGVEDNLVSHAGMTGPVEQPGSRFDEGPVRVSARRPPGLARSRYVGEADQGFAPWSDHVQAFWPVSTEESSLARRLWVRL